MITANCRDAGAILSALRAAVGEIGAGHRKTLHLKGVVSIPADAYLEAATPAAP